MVLQSFSLLLFVLFQSPRVDGRAGDQAPPGECSTFSFGGGQRLHWYACCNNCDEDPRPCDGTTYDSASHGDYCDPCGVDNPAGDGMKGNTYECGGCDMQYDILTDCAIGFENELPDLCWAHMYCFEQRCNDLSSTGGNMGPPNSCFDRQCEDGESVDNCPIDCCQEVNPICRPRPGKCPPLCCSEPTCCAGSTDCSDGRCSECVLKHGESKNRAPSSYTFIGNITSVSLVKQVSSSPCIDGVSYKFEGNTLMITDGCRADFYVCYEPCRYYLDTIRCESFNFANAACESNGIIIKVSVADQQSSSACTAGSSYTVDNSTLHVSNGCRADFDICYIPPGISDGISDEISDGISDPDDEYGEYWGPYYRIRNYCKQRSKCRATDCETY